MATLFQALGAIVYQGFTTAERDDLNAKERMVLYNTMSDQWEMYLSGVWRSIAILDADGNITAAQHGILGDNLHPEYARVAAPEEITAGWALKSGGSLKTTPGSTPAGEIVVQVKTTSGAPSHSASQGVFCWVSPDDYVYINNDGGTSWTKQVKASDLHAQSHTLASHSTKPHSALSDAPTDAHHAQAHGAAQHSVKSDAEAIHDNVAAEISAVTEKATPVNTDLVIIEDSADSNNKKKAQLGNLPGGGAGTDLTTKGDLHGYDTGQARIPVGTNAQVLTADSAQALGLKWADAAGGSSVQRLVLTRAGIIPSAAATGIQDFGEQPPATATYTNIRAIVSTAPSGADLVIDVNDDGVSIGTVTITDGSTSGETTISKSIAADSVMTMDADTSNGTAVNLKVTVEG